MHALRLWPAILGPSIVLAQPPSPWFTEITDEVGLHFVHETGAVGGLEMPEIMGGGCAFLDHDADGDLDIYLTNGSFALSDPAGRGAAADRPRNRLFRREADGRYVDVTVASGVGDDGWGMGVAVGDFDADGLSDLLVTNRGPDRLYRNRGDGGFDDVTAAAGLGTDGWSCSAAFVDYDADGDLDLFVTQYVAFVSGEKECTDASGRPEYCGPKEFPPLPDLLLRNDGDGTFSDVSAPAGVAEVAAAGLGVTCADLDDDGRLDIYVANDAFANHLWLNQGDGTFLDDALLLGAAFNQQGMAEAGMGIVAADFDGDLDLDLFMTHLRNESNTMYCWEGADLGYADCTAERGLGSGSMPTTGFGTVAFDVELDGDLDLLVANGSVNRGDPWPGAEVPSPWDRYAEPNHLWLNEGDRYRLADVGGTLTSRIEVSRGLAVGDADGDGDLDVLLVNVQGPARLYRNDSPRQGRWLLVRPVDPARGGIALGATVTVRAGERRWLRAVSAGVSYLSSSDPRAHFGLGPTDRVDEIVVRWADGSRERFGGGEPDREVVVRRGHGEVIP